MTYRLWARRYIAWLVLPLVLVGAVAAWIAFDPGFRRGHQIANLSTDAPKDEFERRMHDYLMAHPDVIMQSVNQVEARRRAKDETEVQAIVKSRADEIFRDAATPVSGDPNGDVTLVEFFDYNCPYCRQMAPVMTKAEEADPQLRIAYKEFPILGPNSTFAAKAALAANKQGKYVAFQIWRILQSGPRSQKISHWPKRSASTAHRASSWAIRSCVGPQISKRYRA